MRLQQYINEISKVPNEAVDIIIDKSFGIFNEFMSKSRFKPWPLVFLYLLKSFEPFNINFMPSGKIIDKLLKIDYSGATFMDTKGYSTIVIPIKKDQLKGLKNTSYLNSYKKTIRNILIHELTHMMQYNSINLNNIDMSDKELWSKVLGDFSYFANPREIEAYARESLEELKTSPYSDIINMYADEITKLSNGDKVWVRFLKKLYQYIDMYGSKDEIIKLKKQLKTLNKLDDLADKLENLDNLIKTFKGV